MKKTIFVLVVFFLFRQATVLIAEDTVPLPPKPPTTQELIHLAAVKYHVSEKQLSATLKCESGFNPLAVNKTPFEYSVGVAQINLKAHTSISYTQATDVSFSVNYMAQKFALGHQAMWTCYTQLYS